MPPLLQPRYLLSSLNAIRVSQQRCYSIRQKIHRYVEPDKFKKHMLHACQPYIKKVYSLPSERCVGIKKLEHELLPIEHIIVKEILDEIERSDYVLFVQYNYVKFQSERVYKNSIIKAGSTFHDSNNKVYKEIFRKLERDDLQHLFIGRNALVTGKVDNLPATVNLFKKTPQFILLAGYINGHVYNIDQLKAIAVVPNLDQARANLLSTITTPAINLSSNLQQYVEMSGAKNETKSH